FLQGHWGQPGVGNRVAGADQPPAATATAMNASEVDELKRRIEELESLLTRSAPKKSQKKSPQKRQSRRKS
ncbi:MAG: hypothetical protein ABSG11_15810, partial [Candidatus Korobacteraceae bacterium]